MSFSMTIKSKENESKGSVYVEQDGKKLAEMTYSIASVNLIIIDHTEVDETLKGTGTGKQLLMIIIDKARKDNIKILPLCPFAKSVFDKDESLKDVLK